MRTAPGKPRGRLAVQEDFGRLSGIGGSPAVL